jgi:coproporphyrinogen III oxidase-like Fe-S oxidoreductase
VSDDIEHEIRQIVEVMYAVFTATDNVVVREVALDIVRYLPGRSVNEINNILELAKNARIQEACAYALE